MGSAWMMRTFFTMGYLNMTDPNQSEALHTYACAWRAFHETRILCPEIAFFAMKFIAVYSSLPEFREEPDFFVVCRSILGLSQTELADVLGVHRQTVSRWECGLTRPKDAKILDELKAAYEGRSTVLRDGQKYITGSDLIRVTRLVADGDFLGAYELLGTIPGDWSDVMDLIRDMGIERDLGI